MFLPITPFSRRFASPKFLGCRKNVYCYQVSWRVPERAGRAGSRKPGQRSPPPACSSACCTCKPRPCWFSGLQPPSSICSATSLPVLTRVSVPLSGRRRAFARVCLRLRALARVCAAAHARQGAVPWEPGVQARPCAAQGTHLLGFARLLAFARPSGPAALPPAQLLAVPPGESPPAPVAANVMGACPALLSLPVSPPAAVVETLAAANKLAFVHIQRTSCSGMEDADKWLRQRYPANDLPALRRARRLLTDSLESWVWPSTKTS